ncbi:MAG: hypothetical protein HZA08_09750 [Nitrospirae bacterium]|nr:hypothetical protein [Nitrospirota bacterium]
MKKIIAIILLLFVFVLPVRADMDPTFEVVKPTGVGRCEDKGWLTCNWKWVLTALLVIGGGILAIPQPSTSGTIIVK